MKKRILITLSASLLISFVYILLIMRGGGSDAQGVLAADRIFDAADNMRPVSHTAVLPPVDDILSGQTPRDGYILAPTMFGPAGIDTESSFILRTPAGYGVLYPSISIDGQAPPVIMRESENTFIVTPAIPFTSNSVYVFRLTREEYSDITWAFQTTVRFELVSTLPRNESTNVPIRTGIEISFSFGEEINIEEHFSIYPHVEGSFIHRDSTTIFMPTSPLMNGRIYTVTISAGISLPNTSEVIVTGWVFSFETAFITPPEPWEPTRLRTTINFFDRHVEFPSFAAPSARFRLNYDRDRPRPQISMQVYRIDERTQAIDAVNRIAGTPHWSQLSLLNHLVDTSDLTRVYYSYLTENPVEPQRGNEIFTLSTNLPPGFYVFNATSGDFNSQMIIQITDLATQIIADNYRTLVWVNDMTTGRPAAGARVYDPVSGRTFETSTYGIAVVERALLFRDYLIISAADGKESVVFAHIFASQRFHQSSSWHNDGSWSSQPSNNDYWTALQLDRTLFQRNDTLSLWGFVQNRRHQENITYVTAVLSRGGWHYGPNLLHRQNIPVVNGAYSGEIRLPHLDQGNYNLTIFHGDIVLNSTFFTVRDYVKPPYQLTILSNKNAIFVNDEVVFTVRTEFFEGTPVPDLEIYYDYRIRSQNFEGSGRGQTNYDGILEISMNPRITGANMQGERNLTFRGRAALPEVGEAFASSSVRVFINDINVRARATRTDEEASLTVNVHDITLDRINNATAKNWSDFLGAPTAGQRLSVEIMEIYWEKIRDGERYDHITRQVIPRYRHERRERTIQRFEITTNAEGIASKDFQVPNRQNVSYQARITTRDGNGRTITHNVFIGRDFTSFHENANDDRLFLYGVNTEGYNIGEQVELIMMRGIEPVEQGNFLFVVVQNEILSYHIGTNPLTFTFGERHLPNTQVFAYHFNGHTYHVGGTERLRFNPVNRNLIINISTCAETYRPGDMATFNIITTDTEGIPKAANINISLVDEALFALMDYTVDTLEMLYRHVRTRLRMSLATHRTFESDGIDENLVLMPSSAGAAAPAAPQAAPAQEPGGGGDTHIRETFEDTAIFASLRTNAHGRGTFTFRLPDNITSWRVTASAISDDLYAGNTVQNVRVTQPMFLHYTLNDTFLAGDIPYIGVNAFGTSLSGGEQVIFEIWREDAPADIRRATGVSFERVNIPLWEMTEEGFGAIIVSASVDNDYSDAVRHSYQVLNSHRHVDISIFYEVTPDTVFDVNPGGLTNIIFTDHGRGQFLSDLFRLRNTWWGSGARIEGLVARREATRLIRANFPGVPLSGGAGNFNVLEYQIGGGIAILPHASADLRTTVTLMPFILEDVNTAALRNYLRNAFEGSLVDNRMLALYGLAMLGEPVLFDLQRYAMLTDLSVRNSAYVALGFAAIGDMQAAQDIYISRIAPHIQRVAPYYRVDTGTNLADILEATSAAALLASKLGMPESLGLHNYTVRQRFDGRHRFEDDTLLLNIERLLFISHEINNHTDARAGITYTLFGETQTRELRRGGHFVLQIPAQNMHEFNLISVTGDVGAVSIVRAPLEDIEPVESDIIIRREFFKAGTNISTNTFEQGDLVRVQITIDYSASAMPGTYIITDFLPAGLVHVANSARFSNQAGTTGQWVRVMVEGQRITFSDFNRSSDNLSIHYYYARVINPGTFTAEGTVVQSRGAREYMTVGDSTRLTIRP